MTMKSPKTKNVNCHALRAGFTLDDIFNLTKIDRWFLTQIKDLVDFEEELASVAN